MREISDSDTDQPPRGIRQHAVAAKTRSPTKKPELLKMKKVYVAEYVLSREMSVDPITIKFYSHYAEP